MGSLYENIQTACAKKGVSVSRMCLDIGLSKSMMSDLKNGRKKSMTSSTLEKIADYLNVPVDEFLAREQKEKPSETGELAEYLEDLRTRPETRALLEASRGMTKEQIEKMADFAKTLRGTD